MDQQKLKRQSQGLHGRADQIEQALIVIADISGFTHFVTKTPILHSKDIIGELLEAIIQSNRIDLQISEIEGDAILFYRYGEAPSLDEITDQLNAIYTIFEQIIHGYENSKLCCCSACELTNDLAIKVIVHYGPVTSMIVGEFEKLIGPAVIAIHRLLKNSIALDQYALLTKDFIKGISNKENSNTINNPPWIKGEDEYTHLGVLDYYYTDYPFGNRTKNEDSVEVGIENLEEITSLSTPRPMDWVHHVIIDPILQSTHGDITTQLKEPRKVFRLGSLFSLHTDTAKHEFKTVLNSVKSDYIKYAIEFMDISPKSYLLVELTKHNTSCIIKFSVSPHAKQQHKNFLINFAKQIKLISELEYNADDWTAGVF